MKVPPASERAELGRQGAKAAARGEATANNPMLQPPNLPANTGEAEHAWLGRRDAWQQGYDSQADNLAPARPAVAPGPPALERVLLSTTRLLTFAGNRGLTSATGFFFQRDERLFLVTSRHVVFDGPTEHVPDRIEIDLHTDPLDLTRGSTLSILLYRDGVAVWRQAQDGGGEVDVAVIELERRALPPTCVIEPFGLRHLAASPDGIDVGESLAIPGYPLGFHDTVHRLPVVRHAAMASSYGIRFQGKGFFLTDGRTHRGTSGAPVLRRVRDAGPGDEAQGPRWRLLGVHSSRMDMSTRDAVQDESLGLNCAWYADILLTLTQANPAPAAGAPTD